MLLAVALTSGLAGVAVVALLNGGDFFSVKEGTPADASSPPAAAPAPARETAAGCTAATSRTTGAAPARNARHGERYLVKTGDTLWGIATRGYDDTAAAMRRIKRRNGLKRDTLLAGEVLVLPAAGRRSEGSRADDGCRPDDAATDDAAAAP